MENVHRNKNHYKKINMKSIDKPKNAIYNMANMKQTKIKYQMRENDFCMKNKNKIIDVIIFKCQTISRRISYAPLKIVQKRFL